MWIVQLALRRPYTFIVMAILIVIIGTVTIQRTPTDIFPNIDIPVVSVIWQYSGIAPDEMAKRISTISERSATTTVADIEHIESQSYPGITVIKFFFQPGARIEAGVAQLTSITQTLLRIMPPGITPPLILRYSASSVPILQLGLSSKTLSEQQLYDYGANFIRTQLATVQGASIPSPYGGKVRQVMIDLDLQALQSKGLSPQDVTAAVSAQNLILPAGVAKMGSREYNVFLNSSPPAVDLLNDIPVKVINGAIIHMRDVAHVRDGNTVQTNIINSDGRRSALITVLKNGDASTLSVVERVKAALPKIAATLPPELKVVPMADQSVFVRAAIDGVVREAIIAACLTAAMILLFLGSWRSTLIIAVSIPLSILCSIIILGYLGQTLNVMTLGGLALAVGILVDDATVEIENIHRNLGQGKPLQKAILDGAQQIATPTMVSTLSICIVFISVIFLYGPAKFLFTPLALAVVWAMIPSYLLSRTLVPVMAKLMLRKELKLYTHGDEGDGTPQGDWIFRQHQRFNAVFGRFRDSYAGILRFALERPMGTLGLFAVFFVVSLALAPFVGQDFFPSVDAGQLRLHVRCPAGTRLEETERVFHGVDNEIRALIPKDELKLIIDNVGLPVSGINLAQSDTVTIGNADGEILVSLTPEHHPIQRTIEQLRARLKKKYPDVEFFFQPADIVNQILNFGLPAPIDIQVVGKSEENYALAKKISHEVEKIPGTVDVHVHQVLTTPSILLNVDRDRAAGLGLTQSDVASNLLISLSSSGQGSPSFWLDPKSGVSYSVASQTPQYKNDSVQALLNTPVASSGKTQTLLGNVSTVGRGQSAQVVSHYNVQNVFDVYANVQGRDLGTVSRAVDKVIAANSKKLPRGTSINVRGQVESMNASFTGLGAGLLFAILLVYLLIVVNFQSWIDPLIIIGALPGALSGIVWMLFVTQTTFSVPSLMGAIMCMGVSTANSILVITFANDRRAEGDNAYQAALAAGFTRLRPVMMTALAMVIGMLPMSLGLGEGGEQNAPLGRAVIGGLGVATIATLFFVPVLYSVLRRKAPASPEMDSPGS